MKCEKGTDKHRRYDLPNTGRTLFPPIELRELMESLLINSPFIFIVFLHIVHYQLIFSICAFSFVTFVCLSYSHIVQKCLCGGIK